MKKAILILCLSFCTLAGGCPGYAGNRQELIFNATKQIFIRDIYKKELTIELLRQAIYFEKISSPDIVYCQAVLETGMFTSEIFEKANNVFGMRLAKVRQTTAIGEFNYHAKYNHWYDSVRDFKLWQDYFARLGYDLNDYYTFLTTIRYATNKNYINLIKEMS